jgi:Protein of unknown function (DUF3105)
VAKQAKTDRQAVIEQIRTQQKSAEKRRGLAIVGVCAVIALMIVALAAYRPIKNWWDLRQFRDVAIDKIGAPASVCGKETTKKATGNQQHVSDGQEIFYNDAPPAFGEHYGTPDPMQRKLYTADDRPKLGTLVHNLEHGYTILWYDETVADDNEQMSELRGIADKFSGTSNMRFKFKAVPWLESDGKAFPDDQHIAFTHWSIGGADQDPSGDGQVGVWQYCSAVSGDALNEFMLKYPYMDSPEPSAM